jgi:hypothetical protein
MSVEGKHDTAPRIASVKLEGAVEDAGRIHLLRAEWWTPGSRFVLIRYAVDGKEPDLGLRMDMDKRSIMDSLGDDDLDRAVRDRIPQIWELVVGDWSAAERRSFQIAG